MESSPQPTRLSLRFPTLHLASFSLAAAAVGLVLLSVYHHVGSLEESGGSSRRLLGLPTPTTNENEPLYLFPLTKRDIIGITLSALGIVVAAGGGIGGGGFLVPIYILILGFTPKHAIPLSNVTVFGGAVANTVLNLPKRHPTANRPLIDWDIIVLMEPLTVAGAIVGANLNKVLPEAIIVVLLDILLLAMAYKTLQDAIHIYEKETQEQRKAEAQNGHEPEKAQITANGSGAETSRLVGEVLAYGSTNNEVNDLELNKALIENNRKIATDQILVDEQDTPLWNVLVIFAMFFTILIVNVLKGGGSFPSPVGIHCGSSSFWVAQSFLLTVTIVVTIVARLRVLEKARKRARTNYAYLTTDINWDERSTVIFPILSALSGLIAGMFGLGGGIVKGPLMLALGVHPAVTSATAACMILFTSFTATSSFLVFGLLVPEYAAALVLLGFVSTLVGQTIMNYLLKKYHRQSFIAFSIEIVIALSAIAMTIESVYKIAQGNPQGPRNICS